MVEHGLDISEEELNLLRKVDEAIIRAGEIMELGDFDENSPDEEIDNAYEARFHCGKCIVSTVLTEIWDDLRNLMDYYEAKEPRKS